LTGQGGFFDTGYDNNVILPAWGVPYTRDNRFVTGNPYTNYATFRNPLTGASYDPSARTESHSYSATMDYAISNSMSAKAVVGYRSYRTQWASDTDFNPFPIQQTDNVQDHEQLQAEFRLSGTALNDRLAWTA